MNRERDSNADVSPFALKSDGNFGSRVDDIFANLGHLEAKHLANEKARSTSKQAGEDHLLMKDDPRDDSTLLSSKHSQSFRKSSDIRHRNDRGQTESQPGSSRQTCDEAAGSSRDGGFKRPNNPAPRGMGRRGRRVSDHRTHHQNWTYYNLEDVPSMSDRSNTSAAMSFLAGLETESPTKKQKTDHIDVDDGDKMHVDARSDDSSNSTADKIVFKKPTKMGDNKAEQVITKRGCVVQSEYVVGQKSAFKKSKHKVSTASAKSSVSIGHIMDDDDDDDDDDDVDDTLMPLPTRTVFTGCTAKDDGDDPMETEQNFVAFLGKKKKLSARAMRSNKSDGSDDDGDDECIVSATGETRSQVEPACHVADDCEEDVSLDCVD